MDIEKGVLDAYLRGATTRKEIVLWTGLDSDLVDLALDMLIRTGAIAPTKLKTPCTSQGCRNCDQDSSCKPQAAPPGGPVAISLRRK
jgi:hypothetical protein